MIDRKNINDIVTRLLGSIPPGVRNWSKDLEKNFKSVLQHSFRKLDLITREEFDIQVKVLARSRKKLHALEEKLNELEKQQK